eukprot:CAMPEP_0185830700 /NCGR_PEP_ID=MMETSP1353-20130828/1026_1 /TAXON_ID=1077150 /ORGANISM="Erythrolobus australicus, Strain CCMP3124" /LENGTH=154 /DNA_ID=CAMNT_0028528667 /DNA_START=222 /DNA_END=683 /DNA_ORIENTATION=-
MHVTDVLQQVGSPLKLFPARSAFHAFALLGNELARHIRQLHIMHRALLRASDLITRASQFFRHSKLRRFRSSERLRLWALQARHFRHHQRSSAVPGSCAPVQLRQHDRVKAVPAARRLLVIPHKPRKSYAAVHHVFAPSFFLKLNQLLFAQPSL